MAVLVIRKYIPRVIRVLRLLLQNGVGGESNMTKAARVLEMGIKCTEEGERIFLELLDALCKFIEMPNLDYFPHCNIKPGISNLS